MRLTKKQVNEALDRWWSIDEDHYLRYWEPGIRGIEMLRSLLENNPEFFMRITGIRTLSRVSEVTGVSTKELLRRDVLSDKYSLECTNCFGFTGYIPELEGRQCPLCRTGVWIKVLSSELKKLP